MILRAGKIPGLPTMAQLAFPWIVSRFDSLTEEQCRHAGEEFLKLAEEIEGIMYPAETQLPNVIANGDDIRIVNT
jgi:hypothetical protein